MTVSEFFDLDMLPTDDDLRAAKLLKLVVFEPYVRKGKEWWAGQAARLPDATPMQAAVKKLLKIVPTYVDAKPGDYEAIADDLERILKDLSSPDAPLVGKILATNYRGLSQRRIGKFGAALSSFKGAQVLATDYANDVSHPVRTLWLGYVGFNLVTFSPKMSPK